MCCDLPGHWANSSVAFECINKSNVLVGQLKIEHLKVGGDAILCDRFRDDGVTALNLVANEYLGGCLIVFLSQSDDLKLVLSLNCNLFT